MSRRATLQSVRAAACRRARRAHAHRHSHAREVACAQVGVAYGPVVVPTGRAVTVVSTTGDDGERVIERVEDLRTSWEMNLSGDRRGFLPGNLVAEARENAFATRQMHRDLRRVAGVMRP